MKEFTVVLLGGSIGSIRVNSKRELKGLENSSELYTKEDAKKKAASMRKHLSPGERKVYGMTYTFAEVIDGKFTGK